MRIDKYELYLNHMGADESICFPDTYEEYEGLVLLFMQHKGKFLFQSELLAKYRTTVAEDLKRYRNYKQWGTKKHNNTWEPVYYCILADYYIEPDDEFYDLFFAYKLRHIDLMALDQFLAYHLNRYHNNNANEFLRFLSLLLRKHNKLLKIEICETVKEWIEVVKNNPSFQTVTQTLNDNSDKGPIDIDEAASFLKRKKSTLYDMTSENTIPHHKKGNKLYFYKDELDAWVKKGKVKTNEEIQSEATTYIQRKSGRKN